MAQVGILFIQNFDTTNDTIQMTFKKRLPVLASAPPLYALFFVLCVSFQDVGSHQFLSKSPLSALTWEPHRIISLQGVQ